MSQAGNVPILILKEGSGRSRGNEAQNNNFTAGTIIAEVMKSTLGPRGLDKMMVSPIGDATISSDGARILKEMEIQHPAAKILVEAAKVQDSEIGDGTTTVAVLAGELLKKAQVLFEDGIHPTLIVAGFKKAARDAIVILRDIALKADAEDMKTVKKIVKTSIASKVGESADLFADIASEAIRSIVEEFDGKKVTDKTWIQVVKKIGGSLHETRLVKGVIVTKEVAHASMPRRIENAKIALIKCPLEIEKPEMSSQITIKSPQNMKAFLDEETEILRKQVEKISNSGANVAICQKGIDDMALHFLSRAGIIATKSTSFSEIEKLERATGAKTVASIEDLTKSHLGKAGLVEERKLADDKILFIEECKNPRAVAILVRGGLDNVLKEAEGALDDALAVVIALYKEGKAVVGGGAIEAEISKRLRTRATKLKGREQLAYQAFADAMETIPRTLAENAGMDPLDTITQLRTAHAKSTGTHIGVNPHTRKTDDMMKLGVLEPILVKEHAIMGATETATMIMRIDDVITGGKSAPPMPPPGGGGM